MKRRKTFRKRKKYLLSFSIDADKNECHVLMMQKSKKRNKCCWKVVFKRQNCILRKITIWGMILYIRQKFLKEKVRICHKFPDGMNKEQLHMIFPYIPIYTNLRDFLQQYEQYNMNFPYQSYAKLEKMRYKMQYLQCYAADRCWRVLEFNKKLYLYCKWQDDYFKQHIVILDGQTFLSDLNYSEIVMHEKKYLFHMGDLFKYIKLYPEYMLDKYINAGGLRLFFFMTSRYPCHVAELLGKAGFSRLADDFESLKEINIKAKNIGKIFDLPFNVVKIVAASEESLMLFEPEERRLLKKVYMDYKDFYSLPFSQLSGIWMRYYYWDETMQYIIKMHHIDLYESMRYLNGQLKIYKNVYTVFFLYQNYLIYSLRLKKFCGGLYPKDLLKTTQESVNRLNIIYDERKKKLYHLMVMRPEYQKLQENLPGSPYCIVIPNTPEELIDASYKLHNCLDSYVNKIKYHGVMILLIKQKEKNKLIGAIEIRNMKIIQVKGVCNLGIPKEAEMYLAGYFFRKNIS